jgi:hypothetical protein
LDQFDRDRDRYDTAAILEIPDGVSERITFVLEIGPAPQQPATYGVAINYEIYSVVVRVVEQGTWPSELSEHFVHGMPQRGQYKKRKVDRASAELDFYQRIHGRSAFIFREDGGAYVAMAIVPMAKPPSLTIGFNQPDLSIEIIHFQEPKPIHKVRFWVCDKGGRNKVDDLRKHIVSIQLNAEL